MGEPEGRLPTTVAPETGTAFSILGTINKSGAWEPPERLLVFQVLGSANLDFREAELLDGVSEVTIFALLGNTRIIVPPELDIDANGVGVLGSFDHVSRRGDDPDAPVLRIRGISLLGHVKIRDGTAGDTLKRALRKLFG